MGRRLLFILMLMASPQVLGFIELGAGYSSALSGQMIPAVHFRYGWSNSSLSTLSTGYSSSLETFSAYQLAWTWDQNLGELWEHKVEAGFGIGSYVTRRSYRGTGSQDFSSKTDFGVGPEFFVSWLLFDGVFVKTQTLLGMGSGNNLILVFQDMSYLSVGVHW